MSLPRNTFYHHAGTADYDAQGRRVTAAGRNRPSTVWGTDSQGHTGYWRYYADGRKPTFTPQRSATGGSFLRIPETSTGSGVALAGGKAAAAAHPGYQGGSVGTPIDPIYDQQVGAAQRTRDDTLSALAQQRNAGLSSFGYTADLQFDPNNPFSQAALLKRSYDQARRATTTSIAARGGLYSGSLQNAQADVNHRQGQSEDALKRRLVEFLTKNTNAATTAKNDYETKVAQYGADSLNRAQGGL